MTESVEDLRLQIAALRIALAETVSLLIQKKVLTKREAVSHFHGLGDLVMPQIKCARHQRWGTCGLCYQRCAGMALAKPKAVGIFAGQRIDPD